MVPVMRKEKKMEYKIVESNSADGLANQVNMLLACGWELQGGLAANVAVGNGAYTEYFFAQALVRKL
jgi:hypothetical protein